MYRLPFDTSDTLTIPFPGAIVDKTLRLDDYSIGKTQKGVSVFLENASTGLLVMGLDVYIADLIAPEMVSYSISYVNPVVTCTGEFTDAGTNTGDICVGYITVLANEKTTTYPCAVTAGFGTISAVAMFSMATGNTLVIKMSIADAAGNWLADTKLGASYEPPAGDALLDTSIAALSTGTQPTYIPYTGEFVFNGTSQYVRLYDLDPAGDSFGRTVRAGTFTLSAWVNRTSLSGYPFCFRYLGSTQQLGLMVTANNPSTKFYPGAVDISSYTALGAWQHQAFVFSATASLMYIDGVLRATGPASVFANFPEASTGTVGQYMFIGCNNQGTTTANSSFFAGSMMGLHLYPTALSASSVSALYAAGMN